MKLIFKEAGADYDSYIFPYQVYAQPEAADSVEKLYEMGFLAGRVQKQLFYLARSTRVDLKHFELSSENRRILRKNESLELEVIKLSQFEYDYTIGKFAMDYFTQKFKKKLMSPQDIKWILTESDFNYLLVYRDSALNEIVGYCPALMTETLMHYAYPFYKYELYKRNLGMAMMTLAIEYCRQSGLNYGYLGTCYSKSALYKTQFGGFEWFDGAGWSGDVGELKGMVNDVG